MEKQNQNCKVTIENEDGEKIIINLCNDLKKDTLDINITGSPNNLKEHKGFYCTIASVLVGALQREGESADKIEVN